MTAALGVSSYTGGFRVLAFLLKEFHRTLIMGGRFCCMPSFKLPEIYNVDAGIKNHVGSQAGRNCMQQPGRQPSIALESSVCVFFTVLA